MSGNRGNPLLNQAAALDEYLDHLLTPEDSAAAQVTTEAPTVQAVVHHLEPKLKSDEVPVIQPVRLKNDQPVVPVIADVPAVISQSDSPSRPTAAPEGIVPSWAGDQFNCIQLMVDGIPLAFPDHALCSVQDFVQPLRPVKNQPDWVLGLLMQGDGFIAVIDSARLFYKDSDGPKTEIDYTKIVVFGDGRWGLACDSVGDRFPVTSHEVRWRKDNSRRKWLAGMMRHCALVDPDQLFDGA